MRTLAERLQRALDERPGASQADLARYCRAKGPSVSAWFTGDTKALKAHTLLLAAEFLGVRPRWLLDGTGPMREGDAETPRFAAETPAPYAAPADLPGALQVFADAVADMPAARRDSLCAQLEQIVQHPEIRDEVMPALVALLTAPSTKQRAGGA